MSLKCIQHLKKGNCVNGVPSLTGCAKVQQLDDCLRTPHKPASLKPEFLHLPGRALGEVDSLCLPNQHNVIQIPRPGPGGGGLGVPAVRPGLPRHAGHPGGAAGWCHRAGAGPLGQDATIL